MFKVVRRDDPNGKVYAAKNYLDCNSKSKEPFLKEIKGYSLIPESHYFGKLIESFNQYMQRTLILELIEGTTLMECLWTEKRKRLTKAQRSKLEEDREFDVTYKKKFISKELLVKWMLQMAEVVQILQDHGIYYGDLHLKNLMVTSES